MVKGIKFTGDGLHYQFEPEEADYIHAEGTMGGEFTLCSLTLDGDHKTFGSFNYVKGKISCPTCVAIIKHCKQFKI